MKLLLAAVILGSVYTGGSAHQLKWGNCKRFDSIMPNFDPEKFNGTWYVIKKLVTTSPCMMAKFDKKEGNVLTIQEIRTPALTQMGPLDMTVTNVGKLKMGSPEKANMKLEWDGNFMNMFFDTFYAILDTDYVNYALDIECQSMTIFHRLSATIYGRTPTLPQETMKMLEERLRDRGINLNRMSPIDHSKCVPYQNNDYNIKIDEHGLSLTDLMNDQEIQELNTIDQIGEFAREHVPRPMNGH
ncbi:apolipoprotein D-like [Macrobrachium rosenbergii]|uniref:apolipoprotein D-like n=1 Tax=Macrobrachium rosenbergii TaxID=79674 RepID=UPI0034D56396